MGGLLFLRLTPHGPYDTVLSIIDLIPDTDGSRGFDSGDSSDEICFDSSSSTSLSDVTIDVMSRAVSPSSTTCGGLSTL